jgi:hypothetical protein
MLSKKTALQNEETSTIRDNHNMGMRRVSADAG